MALPNGQKFDLLSLALLGTTQFAERFQHIMNKLIDLKFDISDYICIKFILLLNPGEFYFSLYFNLSFFSLYFDLFLFVS